jgi:hypothetical protein
MAEALMLFGMGISLSNEEHEQMRPLAKACYAAFCLANDYFSFDRELDEQNETKHVKLVNAVWLYTQWYGVDIDTAKRMIRETTVEREHHFLELCDKYRVTNAPISEKIDLYLNALSYQVSGNVVWSINCPRHNPSYRYDLSQRYNAASSPASSTMELSDTEATATSSTATDSPLTSPLSSPPASPKTLATSSDDLPSNKDWIGLMKST